MHLCDLTPHDSRGFLNEWKAVCRNEGKCTIPSCCWLTAFRQPARRSARDPVTRFCCERLDGLTPSWLTVGSRFTGGGGRSSSGTLSQWGTLGRGEVSRNGGREPW